MALFKNKPNNKKQPPVKKITIEDLSSEKAKKRMATGMITLLFAGSLGLFYIGNLRANHIKQQADAAGKQVAVLQAKVSRLSNRKTAIDTDVVGTANSAAEAGNKVAQLQNKYSTIDATKQLDALKSNADALDKYFASDDKNARTPWYTKQTSGTATKWEFESVYSFKGKTADVIWLCKNDKGQIYAYTTAVYDTDSQTFSNVKHVQTAIGRAHVRATIEKQNKTKLDEMIKEIQKASANDSKENKFTDQQLDELNKARERMREEYMRKHH